MEVEGYTEVSILIKVWSTVFASLTLCYFVMRKIPKGKLRLVSLLPIVSLFLYLPLYLSSLHFTLATMLFVSVIGSSKLLLFAFDQGPLSSDPSISLLPFVFIACLPIQVKQEKPSPSKTGLSSATFMYTVKLLILALILKTYDYKQLLPQYLLYSIYFCHLYIMVEILLAIAAAPARVICGLEIEKQFDDPYLSTSLQDFWGRRWNIMVSRLLWAAVYQPVRNSLRPIVGRSWGMAVALVATFAVSGFMHELFNFYLARVRPTWEVTWFFLLQSVCLLLEILAKKKLRNRWKVRPLISVLFTNGFVAVITAFWFFFPIIERYELDVRATQECYLLLKFITSNVSSAVHGGL